MKISAAVLAAGNASRFGSNKLMALVQGKPLICHLLDKLKQLGAEDVVIVTQYEAIEKLAEAYHYRCIINSFPQKGLSYSIFLAVKALQNSDAIVFIAADQPYLSLDTLSKLFQDDHEEIISCSVNGCLQNPMRFPSRYFDSLKKLSGDKGAKQIALHNPHMAIAVSEKELKDIDTQFDLEEYS